ncbi:shikimate kinase [Candidatus Aenigmatarchaeota archaeon]
MMHKKTPEIVTPEDSKSYTGGPVGISGPPGAGKTIIGKKIAKKLGVAFYDLDEIISKKVGLKNTKEIIEKYGRPYFWKNEHVCIKEIFKRKSKPYVLAFSGGVICHRNTTPLKEKNKTLIKKNIFHICLMPSSNLKESVSILWPRHDDGKRAGVKTSNQLQSYLKTRMSQYTEGVDRIVYTYYAPIEKVVPAVLEILKK